MSGFQAFIDAAWSEHTVDPEGVAQRLSLKGAALATQPADVLALLRLTAHLWGEHLGRWAEGVAQLRTWAALPAWDGGPSLQDALACHVAALQWCEGRSDALRGLSSPQVVTALAYAAAAMTGRKELARAVTAYGMAVEEVEDEDGLTQWPHEAPVWRALAVAGNNLAAELEELPSRSPAESAAMVQAAQGGLMAWRLAGTWLQEERAEYRLSCSLLKAGRSRDALVAAQRCAALCQANDAPPFERFFAFAAQAQAYRAASDTAGFESSRQEALRWYALTPADERQWCESDRQALG
ncbi:hypothetical protein [Ideonella paludis]|uniref:DUF4034 domain-containing protein n=1 Tax=Ideonella paludis TaxID=1233411 RepID=A0ABS5DVU4_9BURK|nr:hypothetical protein [Ideonella paludis]MBQ0935236.1 hypothetical protein [Ideonella paludis]